MRQTHLQSERGLQSVATIMENDSFAKSSTLDVSCSLWPKYQADIHSFQVFFVFFKVLPLKKINILRKM